MNRLIAVVMLLTLMIIVIEIVFGAYHWWIGWISLVAAASAIGLARFRTIPNASRLGKASDSPEEQSRLARRIYKDHLYCLAAMTLVLVLQLGAHRSASDASREARNRGAAVGGALALRYDTASLHCH